MTGAVISSTPPLDAVPRHSPHTLARRFSVATLAFFGGPTDLLGSAAAAAADDDDAEDD